MGYKIDITLKKGLIAFIYGGIASLIVYLQTLDTTVAMIPVIVGLLKVVENYMKHRKD